MSHFIPELNNADFIWSNKATGKLDPFIADPNSDVYARVVNEYLKPQLIPKKMLSYLHNYLLHLIIYYLH